MWNSNFDIDEEFDSNTENLCFILAGNNQQSLLQKNYYQWDINENIINNIMYSIVL